MDKLELKHYISYIPFSVKIKTDNYIDTIGVVWFDGSIESETECECLHIHEFKLILRPLSDLTKEIEVDGEKFIPIVELAKIAGLKDSFIETTLSGGVLCICYDGGTPHSFFYKNGSFFLGRVDMVGDEWLEDVNIENQITLFQKLFEWHFDIFGLIENRLAIDFNTLSPL